MLFLGVLLFVALNFSLGVRAKTNAAGAVEIDYDAEIKSLKDRLKKIEDAATTRLAQQLVLKEQIQAQSASNIQIHRELGAADQRMKNMEKKFENKLGEADQTRSKLQSELNMVKTQLAELSQKKNIKEYRWKDLSEGKDEGLIVSVKFVKNNDSTALKLTWNGDLRVANGDTTPECNRWYFVINGHECKDPAPIDGAIYVSHPQNMHRPSSIEGLCHNIPKGDVQIDFYVGKCFDGYPRGDAHTCWGSTCRIMIEEM